MISTFLHEKNCTTLYFWTSSGESHKWLVMDASAPQPITNSSMWLTCHSRLWLITHSHAVGYPVHNFLTIIFHQELALMKIVTAPYTHTHTHRTGNNSMKFLWAGMEVKLTSPLQLKVFHYSVQQRQLQLPRLYMPTSSLHFRSVHGILNRSVSS